MSNDISVTRGVGGKIYVVVHPDCASSEAELIDLLTAMQLPLPELVIIQLEAFNDQLDVEGNVIILPIDAANCDDLNLHDVARGCSQAGGHVVVVFGAGFEYVGLHPIADKYGTQCSWSSEDLKKILVGDDVSPTDGTGAVVNRPAAGQVNC